MNKKQVFIIAILLTTYHLYSKEINRESYSLSFGLALDNSWNQNNFKQLSEIKNCCPSVFNESFSKNLIAEVGFRKFIINHFAYFLNLGIVNYNDNFESIENKITADGMSKIKHTMDLNMFNIQNRIGLSNKIYNFGISYGVLNEFIISKKYNQYEELIEPIDATFENDLKKRNVYNDASASYINNYNIGLFTQIWYEFYFDKYQNNALSPYVEFNYMISDYHQSSNFKKFNLVIGIQYRLIYSKDYDTPLVPID